MYDDLIEKMLKLGITENEARVYLALLQKRELSATELHELTQIPRTKIYEITKRMVLKKMCIEKRMGKKKMFMAVEPESAFNNLICKYRNDLAKREQIADYISKTLLPVFKKGRENIEVSDYIEIIDNAYSIHERYVCLVKNTNFEMLGFVKPPYAYQSRIVRLSEQENAEFSILSEGVTVKVLYEYGNEKDLPELAEHIRKCVEHGEKARVIEELPIKMYVFDRRYVLMALSNSENAGSKLTMLVIEHPELAKAAALLFDHLWSSAKDHTYLQNLLTQKKKH